MTDYNKEFLMCFNECYPFEKYIIKNPKKINYLFDDALLCEIFVPNTKIEPVLDDDGKLLYWTEINNDEVYIKVKGNAGEMRFSYFDFASHIREEIRNIFVEDFGDYNYECLYVDHEDDDNQSLLKELDYQKKLITDKYGECITKFDYKTRFDIINNIKEMPSEFSELVDKHFFDLI